MSELYEEFVKIYIQVCAIYFTNHTRFLTTYSTADAYNTTKNHCDDFLQNTHHGCFDNT